MNKQFIFIFIVFFSFLFLNQNNIINPNLSIDETLNAIRIRIKENVHCSHLSSTLKVLLSHDSIITRGINEHHRLMTNEKRFQKILEQFMSTAE